MNSNRETFTPINHTSLDKLNLDDRNIQFSILKYDKHQTLEGLQIEPLAITYIKRLTKSGVEILDVATLIALQKGANRNRCVFVWSDELNEVSLGYIQLLNNLAFKTIYVVRYSDSEKTFYCSKPDRLDKYFPLQEYLHTKRGKQSPIVFPDISRSVRDPERQLSAFWARLQGYFHGAKQFQKVVLLNHILKNFVVQPFFTWLWDLDRIICYKRQYWEMELKHKYPFISRERLYFGINDGQLRLVRDLCNVGLRTLHLILVKPVWDKELDLGYLYNRRDISDRVLLIGTELTEERINQLLTKESKESGNNTSYSGRSKNRFKSIPATDFYVLGSYERKLSGVADNILKLLNNEFDKLQNVTDEILFNSRIILESK
ncbi:MAG: hypothetical protein CENE_02646 [Candidatus Celerinatantimonas neptuna]|nr:MAG: hypothetical protein CENE_02646 [Candidatus Celerinatantimonas neptuna]